MVLASPRADFRPLATAPVDWDNGNEQEHLYLLAVAIRQAQTLLRLMPVTVVSVSADYTMVDIDALIKVDATTGGKTVSLLTAAGRAGRRIIVKKTDASANTVTIDPAGSETLDGSSAISLTQQYAVREYMSDGTNWQLIAAIGNATSL